MPWIRCYLFTWQVMIKCLLNSRHTLRAEALAVSKSHKNPFSQEENILMIGVGEVNHKWIKEVNHFNVFHEEEVWDLHQSICWWPWGHHVHFWSFVFSAVKDSSYRWFLGGLWLFVLSSGETFLNSSLVSDCFLVSNQDGPISAPLQFRALREGEI